MTFILMSIGLLGLAALGAEAGVWYAMKRVQQAAADAAAIAGALTLMTTGGPSDCAANQVAAVTNGRAVAAQNGFADGVKGISVSVQAPPPAGSPFHSHPCAAYVQIVNKLPNIFAAAVIGLGLTTVANSAVAEVKSRTVNCVLALNQVTTNGNISVTGNCGVEANSKASDAIIVSGLSATFSNNILLTPGACTGQCPGPSVLSTNALPGTDPFTGIYDPVSGSGTSFAGVPCLSTQRSNWGPTTLVPSWTASGEKAYCGGNNSATLKVTTGSSLDLSPGTYIFYNMSVDFEGTVTCSTCTTAGGVTIIITGDSGSVGTLTIGSNASVTLAAPPTNSMNAAFNGVLFYMDHNATDGNGNQAAVSIWAGSGSVLTGGMYFPSVTASFGGNANSQSRCTNLVAKNVSFSGTTALNVTACNPNTLSQVNVLSILG